MINFPDVVISMRHVFIPCFHSWWLENLNEQSRKGLYIFVVWGRYMELIDPADPWCSSTAKVVWNWLPQNWFKKIDNKVVILLPTDAWSNPILLLFFLEYAGELCIIVSISFF